MRRHAPACVIGIFIAMWMHQFALMLECRIREWLNHANSKSFNCLLMLNTIKAHGHEYSMIQTYCRFRKNRQISCRFTGLFVAAVVCWVCVLCRSVVAFYLINSIRINRLNQTTSISFCCQDGICVLFVAGSVRCECDIRMKAPIRQITIVKREYGVCGMRISHWIQNRWINWSWSRVRVLTVAQPIHIHICFVYYTVVLYGGRRP